jgi:tripartite-type tricarboxylate transporter receptor subunit TctC
MSRKLGQSVVVENRPGGGTTIGTKAGALAEPDGYTLVQVNAALGTEFRWTREQQGGRIGPRPIDTRL